MTERKTAEELAGINIHKEPIEVKHADLERDDPGTFRSSCPVCHTGFLPGSRDQKTFRILKEDRCLLCGQQFVYTDLLEEEPVKKTKKGKKK
jgi:hypothetical protein